MKMRRHKAGVALEIMSLQLRQLILQVFVAPRDGEEMRKCHLLDNRSIRGKGRSDLKQRFQMV